MWHEQTIIEWSRQVISIIACDHSVKFCAPSAYAFWSQQNGAVTGMWRSCQMQPSQIEFAISAVRYSKERKLLQSLGWYCAQSAIDHERDVCEEQTHIYMIRTSNNRVISLGDLYCCLLPQYEAFHTCCSSFPITTGLSSLSFDLFYQSGLPNGKITLALLLPLLAKENCHAKFWKSQNAVFILPHEATRTGWADQDMGGPGLDRTNGFQKFADQDWIRFNFCGSGLDSGWTISQSIHVCRIFAIFFWIRIWFRYLFCF